MATLYLIPVPLSDSSALDAVLPAASVAAAQGLRHFIVENVRSARRFLRRCDPHFDIDGSTFAELNAHTPAAERETMIAPLLSGHDMGLLSEAGCPAVADPGADIVALAHRHGAAVKPLVGPSSILMGLMASGFNGQSFAFAGYLPIDGSERARKLKALEQRSEREGQTQIFIETPYRNDALLADLCKTLLPDTMLCVATDVTGEKESVATRTVAQWRAAKTAIGKTPTIFLLHRYGPRSIGRKKAFNK